MAINITMVASCRSGQISTASRANIHLPVEPAEDSTILKKQKVDDSPSVVELTDDNGKKTLHARIERDKHGNSQISVRLKEVTVTARMKSIPERFGKVNVDFVVSVPEDLINRQWQLNLTPHLMQGGTLSNLDDVVINGKDFGRLQQKQYGKYAKYLSKIIPDSLSDFYFVKTKAYKKYIDRYNQSELHRVYKDSLDFVNYRLYLDNINRRHALFNDKMYRNREWLRKVMGIPGIKERFVYFEQDTTHIAGIYDKRYWQIVNLLPEFHLLRDFSYKYTPWKYRKPKYEEGYVNTYKPVSSEDSVTIKKLFLKRNRIARNQKLIDNKNLAFSRMIKFPRNDRARLDTVIYSNGKFEYHYKQEVMADENNRQMKVFLDGYVRSFKGENLALPHSDTLNYTVSSMVQFLDTTPHYLRKIIERKVTSSLRANITFRSGKSDMDIDLADNRAELGKIQEMTNQLTKTGEFVMDSISLSAGCSPEGLFRFNLMLSKKRAESIRGYLAKNLSDIEGIGKMLRSYSKAEDWQGLSELVQDSLISINKQQILNLIASAGDPDKKETEIRQTYPVEYKTIRERLYPKLRAVDFIFHVHRKGMVKDTIHTTEPDTVYAKGMKLMLKRKYSTALQVLTEYNDYNTAICLMSLGYNQAACNLLMGQVETANSEYLLSVLASRNGNTEEAVKRYLHSVKLDPSKRFRGRLDPEINKLIKEFNLNKDFQ
ncbi:MAG: hypothetical protein Q8861_00445 [Bacteroidota bacterium]|nr:hypothetical protein [Bacteroidota bacterium]